MPFNELGHFLLVLAAGLSFIQFFAPTIGLRYAYVSVTQMATPAARLNAVVLCVSFLLLVKAFVTSDFSVLLVASNSHTLKPLLYKISGTWGNHEGSLLLWTMILGILGASISLFAKSTPYALHYRALSIQGLIAFAFILFMLATSNPFGRLFPVPLEGRGLNPLLQDVGLAFHPPLLYLGYVGLSVAFSYAAGALVNGRIDAAWAAHIRPWVLFSWSALTTGIALGSWWAYYELGWGGFWFWDPVENAALMPWLASTALLHSVIVTQKRNTLKAWTALLAIVAFSFSLLGTFIVRSGIITSVHAFASDPSRGVWILVLLTLAVGGGLFLYGFRAPLLQSHTVFKPISKEGGLVLNNVLLVTTAGIILTGTLYPVILEALTGTKISVGAPYFEKTAIPIMLLTLLCAGFIPFLNWRRATIKSMVKRSAIASLIALVFFGILYGGNLFLSLDMGFAPTAGISIAIFLLCASSLEWRHFIRRKSAPMALFKIPRLSMVLAHIGIAIFALGAIGASVLKSETITAVKIGESTQIGHYRATLKSLKTIKGPNYMAKRAEIFVHKTGKSFTLYPEKRRYLVANQETTEAAIKSTPLYDIYIAMGDEGKGGEVVFRLYKNPLAIFLWLGALFMVCGGLVALVHKRRAVEC